jgi:hypothetical protein
MATFRLPLSGNVWQDINPFRWISGPIGQISLFSVNLGRSSNPEVEEAVLDVASYGRQLGRLNEALLAVIDNLKTAEFTNEQRNAIEDFKSLTREIAAAKKRVAD